MIMPDHSQPTVFCHSQPTPANINLDRSTFNQSEP